MKLFEHAFQKIVNDVELYKNALGPARLARDAVALSYKLLVLLYGYSKTKTKIFIILCYVIGVSYIIIKYIQYGGWKHKSFI